VLIEDAQAAGYTTDHWPETYRQTWLEGGLGRGFEIVLANTYLDDAMDFYSNGWKSICVSWGWEGVKADPKRAPLRRRKWPSLGDRRWWLRQ